ncbi:hypothetical protein ECG_07312 [Echinococcus granulosus]|nr:hypothetical protein ECG_07312 [Echinococcus granulosus]
MEAEVTSSTAGVDEGNQNIRNVVISAAVRLDLLRDAWFRSSHVPWWSWWCRRWTQKWNGLQRPSIWSTRLPGGNGSRCDAPQRSNFSCFTWNVHAESS